MTLSTLVNGYVLGWSVAWPPGPINAEMIRRGLLPKERGRGFWSAWPIGLGAWKIYRVHRSAEFQTPKNERRGGFLLDLFIVLMSPWNVAFWLAIIGSQPAQSASVRQSLAIAVAVVLGALTWGVILCTALKFGAHVFSHPNWQVATEAITAAVMLWFAIRFLLHFP